MKTIYSSQPAWAPQSILPLAPMSNESIVREDTSNAPHDKLNDEQLRTLAILPGKHAINAGAGTGKSLCLIARMVLINDQYPKAKVLMISFTKKSAMDLRERIGSTSNVTVSTFHSLAYHILQSSGYRFNVITSEAAQESMIRNLIGKHATTLEAVKNSLQQDHDLDKDTLAVRQKYLKQLFSQHLVTFDTMQIFALKVLNDTPQLLDSWQHSYDYWLVDEYQDVDPHQQALIQLLSNRTGNITVVGDVRQSIYSFRGSVPHAMESFAAQAHSYDLTINYRCNPTILGLANKIMAENQPLVSAFHEHDDQYPEYLMAMNPEDEARHVAEKIEQLHKAGHKYQDMTILFRSSSASTAVVQELLTRKIPAISKSAVSLKAAHMPYSGIIKLFRFMLNPDDASAFKALMPILYLRQGLYKTIYSLKTKEKLSWGEAVLRLKLPFFHREYLEELLAAIHSASKMEPTKAVLHLLAHGYGKYIGKECHDSIREMAETISEYPSITAYLAHLDNIQEQIAALKALTAKSDDYIQLMTIHASKGMEWRTVFIIGAYDGCLPSSRDDADINEERRLLYVAVTRAKEHLYISYPRMTEKNNTPNEVSRFLREAFSYGKD
ncbi:MAG: ATP-dependent helicase [Selenomonas sp.]|nr:ATP-dependent helicase [Selenomonas sp.]